MENPKTCKHEHLRKAGVYITIGKKRQKMQCTDCGKILLDGEIIERPASPGKNEQAMNQAPVKENDYV